MAGRKRDVGPLQLVGWSFETNPPRTMAKLREVDGVTYIDVQRLIAGSEMFERLSPADQAGVMEMATERAT